MKIEKLRLVRDELVDEFSPDGIETTLYYFFKSKWNQLDHDAAVSATTASRLERSKDESVAFRPRSSQTAWYSVPEIGCGISITCPASPQGRTLQAYKRRIANVVKRAINSFKVSHNSLTQLLARDAFRESLSSSLSLLSNNSPRSEETQEGVQDKAIAVLALDIDHFKQVNDTHGHIYGDQVLKAFAIRLEETAAKIAAAHGSLIVINIGHPSGEEFLISIFGCLSRSQLLDYANSFRSRICDEPLPSDEEWTRLSTQENLSVIVPPQVHERLVSASVGISIRSTVAVDKNQDQITAILEEADTALYRAKAAGRNQVIAFDDILSRRSRNQTG